MKRAEQNLRVRLEAYENSKKLRAEQKFRLRLKRCWSSMKQRCSNERHEGWLYYGGRGIFVCEEWRVSFDHFFDWALANGWKPGLQLDRRDNDGPYSPENCRYVSPSENNLNRRPSGPKGSGLRWGKVRREKPEGWFSVSKHPLWQTWSSMKMRCGNVRHIAYGRYGGRGIVVCDEWRDRSRPFIVWALANGWKPGLQLDRRDNDGPYSPENCRWVSAMENIHNRSDTNRLMDGRVIAAVARERGANPRTVVQRMRVGWSLEEAIAGFSRESRVSVARRLSEEALR